MSDQWIELVRVIVAAPTPDHAYEVEVLIRPSQPSPLVTVWRARLTQRIAEWRARRAEWLSGSSLPLLDRLAQLERRTPCDD